MRMPQLSLFILLLVCQTTESLTDKQKLTDTPVVILRTFSLGSTIPHLYEERFKDKYSSLTLSRLFISNITIDELGIYYCIKTAGSGLKLSNGTRLYITEVAQDHTCTEVNNNSQNPTVLQALIVLYVILNIVMFLAIIGLLQIKLQLCKKRHKQCQDEELEQLYSTNAEEWSFICPVRPTTL